MSTPTVIAALIEAANEIERLGGDPSRFHKVAHEAPDVLGALKQMVACHGRRALGTSSERKDARMRAHFVISQAEESS